MLCFMNFFFEWYRYEQFLAILICLIWVKLSLKAIPFHPNALIHALISHINIIP